MCKVLKVFAVAGARWTKESYHMLQNNCQHFSAYMLFRWLLHICPLCFLECRLQPLPASTQLLVFIQYSVPSLTICFIVHSRLAPYCLVMPRELV